MYSADQPGSIQRRSLRGTHHDASPRKDPPHLICRQRKVAGDWGELRDFLTRTAAALAPAPYDVCLVSDAAMRRYNGRFREKHEATDVLSFPADRYATGDGAYL